MPPQSANPQAISASGPTPAEALNAILSLDQLTELAALISTITDHMHVQLSSSFEDSSPSTQTHERLQKNVQNPNLASAPHLERGEDAARVQTRSEREVPEAGLLDLRSDVLEWLQKWRDGVVALVIDALTVGKETDYVQGPDGVKSPLSDEVEVEDPYPDLSYNTASSISFISLYPQFPTPLSSLSQSTRTSLLSTMLLVLLSKGHYAAPSRILMLHLITCLHLPLRALQDAEQKLAHGLLESAKQMSASAETAARSAESASARRWKIGLAGVAGAALIGITGGLAAPLVAGAIGTVMGGLGLGATAVAGLLGTLGGSGVLVGTLFGAYGYGMTSQMMERYAKEVGDFAFIPMRRSKIRKEIGSEVKDVATEERRLRVTIGVSGWISENRDIVRPWRVIGTQSEVFALRWELEALLDMGKSLETMVSSAVWAVASREVIARTVFASLMFAMWPIALLKLSKVVDNPFNVAKNRADKAGLVLADAIINKAQGERPVTLIGYSMGARLIYSCLMSLAERRAFGLVESVVLIGAPAPSNSSVWRTLRSVVAGRLVNVYSENDYVLAFLYRTSSIQFGVAGLEAIESVRGVENVDASATGTGHFRYPHLVGTILQNIGWEDINVQEVEREQNFVKLLDMEDEEKMAAQRDMLSKSGGDLGAQYGSQNFHAREPADIKDYRPKLPDKGGSSSEYDLLGAGAEPTTPKDAALEEVVLNAVARYMEQEGPQKIRCRVPGCEKFFKEEHYWKKHVGSRHTDWLEEIKQQVYSSVPDINGKDSEQEKAPALPARPASKPEEQDLISFSDTPPKDIMKGADKDVHTLEIEPHQNIMDMPEEQHKILETYIMKRRHSIKISDEDDEVEAQKITLLDNEEVEIMMLEPTPWVEDEETHMGNRSPHVERRDNSG